MLKRKTNKTETNPADTVDPEFEKKNKEHRTSEPRKKTKQTDREEGSAKGAERN